jgi:hypothetical protein
MADPPRPSTFLEGDFNIVMDDQCQFHRDAKHTMRECEKLKRALRVPLTPRRPRATTMTTGMVASALTTVTVDLIDVITVIAGPVIATMSVIDVIIATTIVATTDATTTVATTITTGVTIARVITVTTRVMTDETIDMMTDVAKTTTTATTTIEKSGLHHHSPKGVTPTVHSSHPNERSTSLSAVAKQPKATDRSDQTQGRSGMSTLKPRSLCVGRSSQSLSPGKIIGSTSPTMGHTRWSLTP